MTRYYVRKSIRRWAFLEPWCAFLREHAELQVVQDPKDDLMLCVRLRPEPGERLSEYDERVRQLRVALELLTMVAFVDVLAWQDLLRDKCGCAHAPFWDGWRRPLGLWLKLGDRKASHISSNDTKFYRNFFLPFTGFAAVAAPTAAAPAATASGSSGSEFEFDHTGAGGQHLSHTVRVALQGILSEMTPEMHREFERHNKVEVCMRFIPRFGIQPDHESAYFQDVVDTATQCLEFAATAQEDVSLRYMSKLTLSDVELHIGDVSLPPGTTHILASFVALNTNTIGFYPSMDIGLRSSLGTMPLVELEPLLRAIATRVSSGSRKIASGCPVEYPVADESFGLVEAKGQPCTPRANLAQTRRFKAFFSALAVSRCFDFLHLECAIDDVSSCTRGKKWQWLAYALFSKESTAGVTKLALSEPHMRQATMNAILSILNTSNPAGKLGGLCRTSSEQARLEAVLALPGEAYLEDEDVVGDEVFDEGNSAGENDEDSDVRRYYLADGGDEAEEKRESPSSVSVRAGTTVQIDPLTSESVPHEHESFVLPVDTIFRVIDDDLRNDWLGILVPCYGYCTVPRNAIVRVECTDESRLETSISWGYRGTIRCLRLNPSWPVPLTPLLPLIQYLGSKLVAFEASENIDLGTTNLRHVLEACPHLKSLSAFLPLNTIDDELLAAYTEGRCNVSDLKLSPVSRAEQMSKFIRALQDSTTRAARIVKKLAVFGDPETAIDRSLLTGLLEVLECNTLLETLRVEVYVTLMKEFKPLFMKFHGQVISGIKHPFPLECRCAFLSVAQYFSEVGESQSKRRRRTRVAQIEHLDRDLVALIFQFAAEPKTREVFVYEIDV